MKDTMKIAMGTILDTMKIAMGTILEKPGAPPPRPAADKEACGRRAADSLRPYIGDMPAMRLVDDWRCWDPAYLDDGLANVDGPREVLHRLMQLGRTMDDLADAGLLGDAGLAKAAVEDFRTLTGQQNFSRSLPATWDVGPEEWLMSKV